MLNKEFGGSVMKKDIREDGVFKINVETSSLIFRYGMVYIVEYFVTQCQRNKATQRPFSAHVFCSFKSVRDMERSHYH